MTNPWISHVKAYQQSHPNLSYREAMVAAKSTYTKKCSGQKKIVVKQVQFGGADGDIIDAVNKLDDDQRISAALAAADKGIDLTKFILNSKERSKRVTERSSRRNSRALRRQDRRQTRKDRRSDRREGRRDRRVKRRENRPMNRRANDRARDEELKDARHEMMLKKIRGE